MFHSVVHRDQLERMAPKILFTYLPYGLVGTFSLARHHSQASCVFARIETNDIRQTWGGHRGSIFRCDELMMSCVLIKVGSLPLYVHLTST